MQLAAIVISLTITAVGLVLLVRAATRIVAYVRLGQPAPGRAARPAARTRTC
jgi:hypothetical protein